MTASSTPSTTAIAIAMTVSSIVTTAAAEIRWSNRYLPYVDQSYASLVAAPQANRNSSVTRMPALIQRPGRRSGTALMGVLLASVMGQLPDAPLISDVSTAPSSRPQSLRMSSYVPSSISDCTAACRALLRSPSLATT